MELCPTPHVLCTLRNIFQPPAAVLDVLQDLEEVICTG